MIPSGAIDDVVNAFASVPNTLVQNPDGNDGITLHVQMVENLLPYELWNCAPYEASLGANRAKFQPFREMKEVYFGTPAEQSSASLLEAKAQAYHYGIVAGGVMGREVGTESPLLGSGEIAGNDFFLCLGTAQVDYLHNHIDENAWRAFVAGIFMHELGHNLGLRHGGVDSIVNKPNYHSVMNYLWIAPAANKIPYPGLDDYCASWTLDYSRTRFNDLDEENLNEVAGIGGHADHFVPIGPQNLFQIVCEAGSIDWDLDEVITAPNPAAPIDRIVRGQFTDAIFPPGHRLLQGAVDWTRLSYGRTLNWIGDTQIGDAENPNEEITAEILGQMWGISFPACLGDVNETGDVSIEDLSVLLSHFGMTGAILWDGDANEDGTVDTADLAIVLSHFGDACQ